MIVIRMQGGLGNQLFQYALYCSLKQRGRAVEIDDRHGFEGDKQRAPMLDVFGITYDRCSEEEYIRITDSSLALTDRVRRKLTGRKSKEIEERDGNYDPRIIEQEDAYLNGYWQCERYFDDGVTPEALFRELTKNRDALLEQAGCAEIGARIGNAPAVSVHLRRGDYLWPGVRETHGDICTDIYYQRAFTRVREALPGARFFIFSNEPDWAAAHYTAPDCEIVRTPAGTDTDSTRRRDAAELLLMGCCGHHILANSSFSWWGAWISRMSRRPDDGAPRLVIAPDYWYNNRQAEGIYTEEMIRVSGKDPEDKV